MADDEVFDRAAEFKKIHDYEGSLSLLLPLLERWSTSAGFHMLVGDNYWKLGSFVTALSYFRKAVELDEKLELASLGVFHSLIQLGDISAAITEANRFQAVSHSHDYEEILKKYREEAEREEG